MECGSQVFGWALPPSSEILEPRPGIPEADLYSDVFKLADGTYWQLCARPSSIWIGQEGCHTREPARSPRRRDNWLGLWLSHRSDFEYDSQKAQMRYSLIIQQDGPWSRQLAGHEDEWSSQNDYEMRGSYWFLNHRDIAKSGSERLRVILTVVFNKNMTGRSLPASHQSESKVTVLSGHGLSYKVASAILKNKLQKFIDYEFQIPNSDLRAFDLTALTDTAETLQAFVHLLKKPCESSLARSSQPTIRSVATLCRDLNFLYHAKIAERSLIPVAKENCPVHEETKDWSRTFWISVTEESTPIDAFKQKLIVVAISHEHETLKTFISKRKALLGKLIAEGLEVLIKHIAGNVNLLNAFKRDLFVARGWKSNSPPASPKSISPAA